VVAVAVVVVVVVTASVEAVDRSVDPLAAAVAVDSVDPCRHHPSAQHRPCDQHHPVGISALHRHAIT
jgi:hypothetical protein